MHRYQCNAFSSSVDILTVNGSTLLNGTVGLRQKKLFLVFNQVLKYFLLLK